MSTQPATPPSVEALLEAAGFVFEVVSRCPDPRCSVCDAAALGKAA